MKIIYNILNLLFIILFIFIFCVHHVHTGNPLGYCVDAVCSVPISHGRTIQRYSAPAPNVLSFDPNMEVVIFVNHYGLKSDLLGVEIHGVRGYIPRTMVKETRLLNRATVPLQTDFMILPRASINQESSHFGSTTYQPPSVPYTSPSINHPELISSLPLQAAGVPESTNHISSSQLMSNLDPNHPSISQFGGHPVYQSSSFFPNSDAPSPETARVGATIDQPNPLSPVVFENIPTPSPVLPTSNNVNPGLSGFDSAVLDSLSSPHQGHISQPVPNMQPPHGTPEKLITPDIQTSNSVFQPNLPEEKNFVTPQVPPVPSQNFAGHANLHSNTLLPDPNSVSNMQFQGQNIQGVPLSTRQSLTDLEKAQLSSLMDSVTVDTLSNTPTDDFDFDDYTSSLLDKIGYDTKDMYNSVDDHKFNSPAHKLLKTDTPSVPTENPNIVKDSNTDAPEVHSASAEADPVNDKTVESSSTVASTEQPKSDEFSVDEDQSTSNNNKVANALDDANPYDDDEEDTSDDTNEEEDDEGEEEENEDDGVDDSHAETLSEGIASSVSEGSVQKTTEEVSTVDNSASIEEHSSATEFHSSETFNDHAAVVNQKSSLPDGADHIEASVTSAIEEVTQMADTNKHLDDTYTPDSVQSPSCDTMNESEDSIHDESLKEDPQNDPSSVLSAVTQSSVFENNEEFAQSASNMDYSAKPTRSILQQDNDGPNASNIGSKPEELNEDDEAFHQDEAAYAKPTSEESVVVSTVLKTLSNLMLALRSFLDRVISFLPEPIYSYLMDLNASGISSRAIVFTFFMSFPCIFLFLSALFLKESSKEHIIIAKLTEAEHQLYLASTERNLLREEVTSFKTQISELGANLERERSLSSTLQTEVQDFEQANQCANMDQKEKMSVIRSLEKQISQYERTTIDLERLLSEEQDKAEDSFQKLQGEEALVDELRAENENLKEDIDRLHSEKDALLAEEDLYKEKLSQLEVYCNEVREETDYHSGRAAELSDQISSYETRIEELRKDISAKDREIEDLRSAMSNIEVLQKMKGSGDADDKSIEEKLTALLDISSVQNKLMKAETEKESLLDKLKEKTKDCDEMKVDLLELKSEIENLKMQKERAVEDKTQAQSELSVLEKYFKEKEVKLQMELGTQLTVRQQKEMDVSQAHRRVFQLEEENASYKSQTTTLKLEIEETERNLKKQIAAHEESAHKNWVAARAAERKAEEAKQEVAQFRQRVTLLERERETWSNSSQSDVIKPVPQRISDPLHDVSQGGNISGEFKPEFMLPRHLPPPMMHPILPPPPHSGHGPPPPMMPPSFMPPPFNPMVPPPPRRPPPWHLMQDKSLDYDHRNTPSDFESSTSSRRPHTPPDYESSRRHHTPPDFESYRSSRMPHTPPFYGREGDKRSSSPVEGSNNSRSSSPLPDFHSVPPPLSRHRDNLPQPVRYPPHSSMPRRDYDYVPSRSGKTDDRGGGHKGESRNSPRARDY